MKPKFCMYCGAENEADAKKCVSCNADLIVDEDTTEPVAAESQVSEPTVNVNHSEPAADIQEPESTLSKNYAHTADSQNANYKGSKNDAPFIASQTAESTEDSQYSEPTVNTVHSAPANEPEYSETTAPIDYPVSTADPEYYEPAPKPKKAGTSVIAKIATVFLCMILFLTTTATAILYAIQRVIDEDNIESFIDEIDLYETAELLNGEPFMEDGVEYSFTFGNYKVRNIYAKSMKKIVNSGEVSDFLSEKLIEYVDYIKTGNGDGCIDENDIVDLLKDLKKKIQNTFGYAPTDDDYKEIKKILKKTDLSDFDLSELRNDEPVLFNSIGLALSDYMFYGTIALDVLLMAVILFINKRKISGGFKAVSCVLIINGIVFAGAFITAKIIPTILDRDVRKIINVLAPLTDNAVNSILFVGMALAAVGILTLVIIAVVKSISNKIRSKKTPAMTDTRY